MSRYIALLPMVLRLAILVPAAGCSAEEYEDCAIDAGTSECQRGDPPPFNSTGGGDNDEEPGPADFDDPASLDETHQLTCAALEARTCGLTEAHTCDEMPACIAAELLSRYEPSACEEALLNEESYPPCEAGVCYLLEAKVCGAEQECLDLSICQVARTWRTQFEESQSAPERDELERACNAALLDETVFPACE